MHVVGISNLLLLVAEQYSQYGCPKTSFNNTKSNPRSLPLLCSPRSCSFLADGAPRGTHLSFLLGGENPDHLALFSFRSLEGKPAPPCSLCRLGLRLAPAAPASTLLCFCCLPPSPTPPGSLLTWDKVQFHPAWVKALYVFKAVVQMQFNQQGNPLSCWQPL